MYKIEYSESLWDRYAEIAFEKLIEANENVPDLTGRSPAQIAAHAAAYADAMVLKREKQIPKEEPHARNP